MHSKASHFLMSAELRQMLLYNLKVNGTLIRVMNYDLLNVASLMLKLQNQYTHMSQSGQTLDDGNKLKVMANVTFPFRKSFSTMTMLMNVIFSSILVEFLASFV